MRSHGWSRDRSDVKTWNANLSNTDSKFLFVSTGYNVRPMEIQAAIGSLQIDEIDFFVSKRREIARKVGIALNGSSLKIIGAETLYTTEESKSHSWMLIPLIVEGENAPARKKQMILELEKLEIETRPVLTGNFLSQPAIQRIMRHSVDPANFTCANRVTETAFLVGAHHDLSDEQVSFLCDALQRISQI